MATALKLFTIFIILSSIAFFPALAQSPDSIYQKNIKTAMLYNSGDQLSLAAINLNSGDQMELHFDDMDADIKYYYYTYQICDQDWTPVELSQFDYIKGFTEGRITTYRRSSFAYTIYTHYSAILPDNNCMPSRSGNYILKVYLDGDTSKLAFTRRLLVLDNKSTIKAQVTQPFSPQYYKTHQKVQFTVNVRGLDAFSPSQQVKVVILQNHRWDNALTGITPTFVRGNQLEYNTEDNAIFPAGKEWRWLDIRDFRLQSERVTRAEYGKNTTDIYVKPDMERASMKYLYYQDFNGMFTIDNTVNLNPFWQGDYATCHFTFLPPDGNPYIGKDLYLAGKLTDYNLTDSIKMKFNAEKGYYETKLYLKQGYYNYTYLAVDRQNPALRNELDGNYFETENEYTILIYYRSFTDRSDQLIGISRINSRTDRAGFSF